MMSIQMISTLLDKYNAIVFIGIMIIFLIMLFLFIYLCKELSYMRKRYKKMMAGTAAENIEEMIISHVNDMQRLNEQQLALEENQRAILEKLERTIQKVGVVRYRAFENLSGDLSYSIALLDAHDNGVVITGIYHSDGSQTYAKPIKNGQSTYALSTEEIKAIEEAISQVL